MQEKKAELKLSHENLVSIVDRYNESLDFTESYHHEGTSQLEKIQEVQSLIETSRLLDSQNFAGTSEKVAISDKSTP